MNICFNCGSEIADAGRCATCGAYTKVVVSDQGNAAYTPPARKLVRPKEGRVIAGVCAGIAGRYGIPINLVRLVFIIPGILWLVGPITYVVIAARTKEWPPATPEPKSVELRNQSAELERVSTEARHGKSSAWVVICCIVAGAIVAAAAQNASLLLLVLLIGIPLGLVLAIRKDREKSKLARLAKKEAERVAIEAVVRKFCFQCEETLAAGAVVCPKCGGTKLLVSPKEYEEAKKRVTRPGPRVSYPPGSCNVVVTNLGSNKWQTIRTISRLTNLSLEEIRNSQAERRNGSRPVVRGVSPEAAEHLKEVLISVGATVEVRS